MSMQIEYQEFETGVLGAPVARLLPGKGEGPFPPKAWLISSRISASNTKRIKAIKEVGFREIESLITVRRPIEAVEGGALPQLAKSSDFDACLDIGRTSFTFDRFHADPGVPNAAASKLKETWVKNSLEGRADAVFVTRENGQTTGFNLCRLGERKVTIDLIAIANDMKGRGLGEKLIEQALNYYAGKADFICAGTQTNNAASNRLYFKTGFSEFSQQKTLHWINTNVSPEAFPLKIGIAVFSRMDSNRLPGKALTKIGGRSMLGRVLDQLKKISRYSPLIVATSDQGIDDPIAKLAKDEDIAVFRGSDSNVLERAANCARRFNLDALVRISGDSPFIDGALIEKLVAVHRQTVPDLTTNVFPRTLPPGMSVEVISTSVLNRLQSMATDKDDNEHVTKYIYDHADEFHIHPVIFKKNNYDNVHLAVDTQHDLERATWIANQATEISLEKVAGLARQWDSQHPNARPGK
jgi:spore coat polysaccharide biosynthesis protein SpsF